MEAHKASRRETRLGQERCRGGDIMKNVKNISLPGITHEQFCEGAKISSGKYKGIKITKLVLDNLK